MFAARFRSLPIGFRLLIATLVGTIVFFGIVGVFLLALLFGRGGDPDPLRLLALTWLVSAGLVALGLYLAVLEGELADLKNGVVLAGLAFFVLRWLLG